PRAGRARRRLRPRLRPRLNLTEPRPDGPQGTHRQGSPAPPHGGEVRREAPPPPGGGEVGGAPEAPPRRQPRPPPQPLRPHRPPPRIYAEVRRLPRRLPRDGARRQDPRRPQVQLVVAGLKVEGHKSSGLRLADLRPLHPLAVKRAEPPELAEEAP